MLENLKKELSEIFDRYKWNAKTYIETTLDEYRASRKIELDEVSYNPDTNELKSTYRMRNGYIVFNENINMRNGQAFRVKMFSGKKEILNRIEVN